MSRRIGALAHDERRWDVKQKKWCKPTDSREYQTWKHMKERCNNPNHSQFADYGGRGISVCDRWVYSFDAFYQDMGEKPIGMTLERINNNGNYEPSNCKWATRSDQRRNQRNTNLITYGGITLALSDWAVKVGIKRKALCARIHRGWPLDKALTK